MSRTVDERIVQMTFDNKEFETRAKQTASTLGKLSDCIKSSNFSAGLVNINKESNKFDLSSITKAAYGVSDSFSAMEQIAIGAFRKIGDAAATYVLGGLNKIKSGITSLTTDQMSVGFNKYTDLTGSVQTLVNSTGKSVEEINGYLEKLMWYSDETSFGFTDMTKALSTMVSSGGDMDKLIPMIMGMGNATAYAGKGAAEFQRVIYNLNQSYGSGALTLMDWKSVENAGASSKALKEVIIQTAEEIGTIKKGQIEVGKFNESLKDKWVTSEVMEKAFTKFAEVTEAAYELVDAGKFELASDAIEYLSGQYDILSERAFKSAQEAKSFEEAIEATKDAVSTGWLTTWQTIFGDYNESKALWTDVTETLWELFASGASARNEILANWKDFWKASLNDHDNEMIAKRAAAGLKGYSLPSINSAADYEAWQKTLAENEEYLEANSGYLTQTQALIAAISDAILAIKEDIIAVWNSVFPFPGFVNELGEYVTDFESVGRKIFDIIERIREAFINFVEEGRNSDFAVAIRNGLRAVLQIFKTLIEYAKVFKTSFIDPLVEKFKPIISDIVRIFNKLFGLVNRGAVDARNNIGGFQTFLENILKILDPLISVFGKIIGFIADLIDKTKQVTAVNTAFTLLSDTIGFIANVISGSVNLFSGLFFKLSGVLDKIKETLGGFLEAHGAQAADLAKGGMIAYILAGLSIIVTKLKGLDLKTVVDTVGKFLKGEMIPKTGLIDGIKGVFGALSDGFVQLKESIQIKNIDQISNAILKLAAALLIISLINSDRLTSSLAAMGAALGEVIGAIYAMSKIGGGKGQMAVLSAALISIGVALIEVSAALMIISKIDSKKLIPSLFVMGAMLAAIGAFIVIVNKNTKSELWEKGNSVSRVAKAVKAIGLGLIEIAAALWIVSKIGTVGQMMSAVATVSIALAAIGAFIVLVSKFTQESSGLKIAAIGVSVNMIAFALIQLSAAMWILSKIKASEMDTALKGLFFTLMSIAAFAAVLSMAGGGGTFIAVSAGMVIMSVAIIALTGALALLSKLGWDRILNGLGMLAAVLATIGLGSAFLGLLAPLIIKFSIALTIFGAALYMVSKGMAEFIAVAALFQVTGTTISATLGQLILEFAAVVVELIPNLILGIAKGLLNVFGQLLDVVGQGLMMILEKIKEYAPAVISTAVEVAMMILVAIRNSIAEFVNVGVEIVIGLIQGLGEALPDLLDAGFKLLVDLINGMADAIKSNAGEVGSAIGNLCSSLVSAVVNGFGSAVVSFGSGIVDAGKSLFSTIKNAFTGGSQQSESKDAGEAIVDNVGTGMEGASQELNETSSKVASDAVEQMDKSEEAQDTGDNIVDGFIQAAKDPKNIQRVYDAYENLGNISDLAMKDGAGVRSPSWKAEETAGYIIKGLTLGMKAGISDVYASGDETGNAVMDALASAIESADSLLEEDMNPVITPILDMSNIENGASSISSILGDQSYNSALSINRSSRFGAQNQNGASSGGVNVNIDFTINQAGKDLSEADFIKYGNEIAKIVNDKLGKMVA